MHRSASIIVLAGLTLALSGYTRGGCGGGSDEQGSLGADESSLVADSNETDELDGQLESGLEEPASGAQPADPGAPPVESVASGSDAAAATRTNIGLFFKPAGCIATTVTGNVATHVFTDCTGPYGFWLYNGTVTSTWSIVGHKLVVQHEAQGFSINGATVDHAATIEYSRSGTLYTKHRVADTSGTTRTNKAIVHHADYVTTYDTAARCITRDGASSTTIGGRSVSRSISGYRRCGIGFGGCPEAGTYTVTRTKPPLTVVITFPGGAEMDVALSSGAVFTVPLACKP